MADGVAERLEPCQGGFLDQGFVEFSHDASLRIECGAAAR